MVEQGLRLISLLINGETFEVKVADSWTLLYVLREKLGLTGTKHGCGQGECGACTVLVDGEAVSSCQALAMEMEGHAITTVEGLTTAGGLHSVQQAFIDNFALQCGFCTPGMIMATVSLLKDNPNPSEEEIVRALTGNLCRCGSYPNIIKAVKDAASKYVQAVTS